MKQYTLVILKHDNKVYLVNRSKNPWKGLWNFIGGKIESNESPHDAALRELYEETRSGLLLSKETLIPRGTMKWEEGVLHIFMADLDKRYDAVLNMLYTPYKDDEGIYDWKEISWLDNNEGVVLNAKYILDALIDSIGAYEFEYFVDTNTITHRRIDS